MCNDAACCMFSNGLLCCYIYICSTASGCTRVFYDPRISKKGVLLSATKAPKREKDPTDYAIMGEILNPHALPMYRVRISLYCFLFSFSNTQFHFCRKRTL